MKKNKVFVHLLVFFLLGYTSAMGQRQSQAASVPKQEVKTKARSEQSNKLTSVAKKYLKKMEKSRNHALRGKAQSSPLTMKGKVQQQASKMGDKKKSPQKKGAPSVATDKRKTPAIVKK
ncbi:MAG: hypothetical protein HRU41_20225 [Saprospiraceae bacterium]|nr:hypothetical protein [Saprospiraceae bacterium]